MLLSLTVFSLMFAFYNFYKECSTVSSPRSFWSLILCFNVLLSIFITLFHNLSLLLFDPLIDIVPYNFFILIHNLNIVHQIQFRMCSLPLVFLLYLHTFIFSPSTEMLQKLFSQLLKFFLQVHKFKENFKHSQFCHISFHFLERTMVVIAFRNHSTWCFKFHCC